MGHREFFIREGGSILRIGLIAASFVAFFSGEIRDGVIFAVLWLIAAAVTFWLYPAEED